MIIKKDTARQLPVLFIDSSDFITGTIGIVFGDVTVKYLKDGESAWNTLSINAGNWTEIGDGLYMVSFTDTEIDTDGNFNYLAYVASGSIDYFGWVDVQDNLNNDLATEVNATTNKDEILAGQQTNRNINTRGR